MPALQLWQRAAAAAPEYVPALANLATLLAGDGSGTRTTTVRTELERRIAGAGSLLALDGPVLPLGYAAVAVDRSAALQQAIRTGNPAHYARTFAPSQAGSTAAVSAALA